MCTQSLNGVRRKLRIISQRKLLLIGLFGCSLLLFSYLNLEVCYKILAHSTLNRMCNRYKMKKYSGLLCDELCNGESFKDFKCADTGFRTTAFTAVKNHDIYDFKIAGHFEDAIMWKDKKGNRHYPPIEDFQNIIKRYLTIDYNMTVDDDLIRALLSQEIDLNVPEQIGSTWRLFKDSNYIIGKLLEEESVFPIIFGSCGPIYATEHLKSIQPDTGFRQFMPMDWTGRLKLAISILDFLYRLDDIKPEPIKMCKIKIKDFGISLDKRVKYRSAQNVQFESQLDKILSDGSYCKTDSDCRYESCVGKCDRQKNQCLGIQQNNNFQIVCEQIFRGSRFNPGLLATAKTPTNLSSIIELCINPSRSRKYHQPNRIMAPTNELTLNLYNEIKRLYNKITFHQ